jgi:hypothetical protein
MILLLLGAVLWASAAGGCIGIDGGAIDLSWVVYCSSGQQPDATGQDPASPRCSCNLRAGALARVRLSVIGVGGGPADDACGGRTECEFDAGRQSGTTGFFVPPGDYAIALVPVDAAGTALGGSDCDLAGATGCWATPAPVRRTVTTGQIVSLGALLVAVPDCPAAGACQPSPGCPAAP